MPLRSTKHHHLHHWPPLASLRRSGAAEGAERRGQRRATRRGLRTERPQRRQDRGTEGAPEFMGISGFSDCSLIGSLLVDGQLIETKW